MRREAEVALAAAQEAAAVVMRVYATAFAVEMKAADDPVTIADKQANELLCERLEKAFPGVPVVAEESDRARYAGYAQAGAAWFVDPLDGTREFVLRNGEFAVMVGLAERGRATVGVIVAPAWGRAFAGVVGEGAWEIAANGSRAPIRVTDRDKMVGASVVVSRSRSPERVMTFMASMGAAPPVRHGSSGLKAVLVATGAHDAYLQPGNAGLRWDACAAEALVKAAGGECTTAYGEPFDYRDASLENSRGLLATNGKVHAEILAALAAGRS